MSGKLEPTIDAGPQKSLGCRPSCVPVCGRGKPSGSRSRRTELDDDTESALDVTAHRDGSSKVRMEGSSSGHVGKIGKGVPRCCRHVAHRTVAFLRPSALTTHFSLLLNRANSYRRFGCVAALPLNSLSATASTDRAVRLDRAGWLGRTKVCHMSSRGYRVSAALWPPW